MAAKSCTVYGLFSTRDGAVRYVGQTRRELAERLGNHLMQSVRLARPFDGWLRQEINDGFAIGIRALVVDAEWCVAERRTIQELRASGADLWNITPEEKAAMSSLASRALWDRIGRKPKVTPRTKEQIRELARAQMKQRWADPAIAATMRAKLDASHSEAWREGIALSLRGRSLTQEHKQRIREGHLRRRGRAA
jgi:hypothetical protein